MMMPVDLSTARRIVGERWGLGRPLSYAETARALRMAGASGGDTVRLWERNPSKMTGPASVALFYMIIDGMPPPRPLSEIVARRGRPVDTDRDSA